MSLPPGSRLAAYEIVSAVGAGGMGEVYRARDTKLGRDVAIKLLPDRYASDRERVARFEREARTLASLNHPHIAQVYGLEVYDGPAEVGRYMLVMELVEGEDLSQRIARGPIAIDDALTIAAQIADALETTHEQGIVHRDLKPANIKLRSDGTVKVLDFGIAKVVHPAEESAELPTISATGRGVFIGTAAYMSPEQARAGDVTRRSDVWAFGAVLFEMLTGTRAFPGATTSDAIAAILQGTPDWTALPASTPPAIVRLVRRCLEREPKRRLHDIGDARIEIEDAQRTGGGDAAGASHEQRATTWRRTAALLTAAAIGALAVGAYVSQPARDETGREVRLQMAPPAGMRFVSVPAVSPDGLQIVFAAAPESGGPARLWLRPLAASTPTELPGTAGAAFPFWSDDSRVVAFFADGQMKRLPAGGGNPVVICEASAGRGGLWLEDGTIVFAPTGNSPLLRVNAAGGTPEPFTQLSEDETGHRFPQRLPARQLLYFAVNRAPEKSGTRHIALEDPNRAISYMTSRGVAQYVNGFLVYVPSGVGGAVPLLAQRMALPGGLLSGEPIEIGQTRISEVLGRHVVSTAPGGVIAMLGPAEATGQFTWISRDGRQLDTVGTPESQLGVELSPDGQHVATFRSGEIWTLNLARPAPVRATQGGQNRHPIWSADGERIATLFQGRGLGTFDLVTTSLATGKTETVRQHGTAIKPMGWLNDGRLVWTEATVGGQAEASIWTKPAAGPAAPFLRDRAQVFEARVSKDQQWIAYASNRSGRFEIEVSGFPEPGRRYPVSVEGGGYPRWRADGRELYFLSADGRLMAASFTAGTPPVIGPPAPLFEVRLIAHPDRGMFAAFEYDVNADGSRFLINRLVSPPDPNMTVIVGWNPPR